MSGCILPGQPDEPPPGDDPLAKLVDEIKDHPDNLEAHANLYRAQKGRGDAQGAQDTVTHALSHCGKDFRAHLLAADFHHWQKDFITAEKALLKAKDLAPSDPVARVSLAALYCDTLLEADELEQRRIAISLAKPEHRAELELDYAFAMALAGRANEAGEAARRVLAAEGAVKDRFRAWILLGQLALDAGQESEAAAFALEARRDAPRERGPVKFAARLAGALHNPEPLMGLFNEVLDKQEDPDSRFFALFGAWTALTKLAIVLGKDPDGPEPHAYWVRLRDLDPGQLDAVMRRYQLVSLLPGHEEEKSALKAMLEERKATPPALTRLSDLVHFWRAQDCLMLSAAKPALAEVQALEQRWRSDDLQLLKVNALFGSRTDEPCMVQLALLKERYKAELPELRFMRWVIQLRLGQDVSVMREIEAMGEAEKADNSTLLMVAVARFRVYRKKIAKDGK